MQHLGLCILPQAFRSRSRSNKFSALLLYPILDTLTLTLLAKMRFTILSTITALAAATLTSANPLEARQDTLLPFEVTHVGSNRRSPALGADPCTNPLVSAPIRYTSHSLS
jgi:hypothetical protein